MQWTTLGTITPTITWQIYSSLTQARVFRLSHSWTLPTWGTPRALIAQFYGNDALGVRRIFARQGSSEIIELPIPEDLIAEGELTRQIGVKLLLPRYSQLYTTNWAITLEALDAQVTAVGLGDLFDEITQTEADILADIDQLRNDLLS